MNRTFSLLLFALIFTACGTPLESAPRATVSPSTLPATATLTPIPTAASKPTRTPKPTPTLPELAEMACIPADGERVSGIVTKVIDGDTVEVSIQSLTFKIRYIGIDTPETNGGSSAAERMSIEAWKRNQDLVSGKRVTLVRDPANDDRDIYGRLLRYIIQGETFVNYQLVREGFARLYLSGHSCGPNFFAAYEAAQKDHIGLWAPTLTPEE
jgi:micrococcal nuclease